VWAILLVQSTALYARHGLSFDRLIYIEDLRSSPDRRMDPIARPMILPCSLMSTVPLNNREVVEEQGK
jgi:hypothetical protein